MANRKHQKPVVLVLAGHDPSGGAGVQADIESIANAGCCATTVITSLTTQNSCKITNIIPQQAKDFRQQIELIIEDISIHACKVGMIGNDNLIETIQDVLSPLEIPCVIDPVLSSTNGKSFVSEHTKQSIMTRILPIASVITPNSNEAKSLTGVDCISTAAEILLDRGPDTVFITDCEPNSHKVINISYKPNQAAQEYHYDRLPGSFHGSGCTLSARIAANLAKGETMEDALQEAQDYTWNTLKYGISIVKCQAQPDRFYNSNSFEKE